MEAWWGWCTDDSVRYVSQPSKAIGSAYFKLVTFGENVRPVFRFSSGKSDNEGVEMVGSARMLSERQHRKNTI